MHDETRLVAAGMVMLSIATSVLVVIPYMQVRDVPPPADLRPYGPAELRGRQLYISNGCVYCHSQQPRAAAFAPDGLRGWGRPSVSNDYAYDNPHLLGTMRTGPDLFNIGERQPSEAWHLGHLYQPRAYVPGSIMPGFPWLFDVKEKAQTGDVVLTLPLHYQPFGKVVVATPSALDLVAYLRALNHTYPALVPTRAASAPSNPQ